MPTSKDTNDLYVEKESRRVALECATKHKKEGTAGCMAKLMVTISHGRGVIEYFPYEGNINGKLFPQFVRERFSHFFSNGNNQKGKLFLQDEDHSQNFKMPQDAMNKISYRLL